MNSSSISGNNRHTSLMSGLLEGDRHGIRFRLSVLLLLSTFNAVALAAGATVLFRAILAGPTPSDTSVRAAMDAVNEVQNDLLLMAVRGHGQEAPRNTDPRSVLQEVMHDLAALGKAAHVVQRHLGAYDRLVGEWLAYMEERRTEQGGADTAGGTLGPVLEATPGASPAATGTPGQTPPVTAGMIDALAAGDQDLSVLRLDDAGQALLARLNRQYRTLLGELALLATQVRPDWIDKSTPWIPWVMGYVVIFGLITMGMAFRLRTVLSIPLEKLRSAAGAVAAGRIEDMLSTPDAATEIRELAQSMETMRERLVSLITRLDARTHELSCILYSLSDGVLVLDDRERITEFNPRAQEILSDRQGSAMRPVRGVPLDRVLPELGDGSLLEKLGQDIEIVLALQGGKERHVVARVEPVRREGAGEVVVVLRDVSREHELERMKRDFLSVVTHELKTPLTSIEGYSRLLVMGKGGHLTETQREFVQTIVDQSRILKEMVQNLLDITRIEGQNLPINPALVDPFEEARTAAGRIRGSVQSRGLTLEVDIREVPDTRIHVDPFRLQQILGNLLNNALKFTEPGGTITLRAWRDAGTVHMAVEDTGRGIPAEAIPHLFDKFYQVTQGDTRLSGGAGLGLYICKQLAEAQGGTIDVVSDVGKGSTFTLRFPVAGTVEDTGDEASREDSDTDRD